MRHKHGCRRLGRISPYRGALLKNLTIALVNSRKIETTLPKAKELRSYIEGLIIRTREGDFNTHRAVFASLQDRYATNKLVSGIAPQFKERKGGYTKIIRTRVRRGDIVGMTFIELVA